MTLQRANPLPVGNYWQDVMYSRLAGFDQWLRRYSNKVRVTATEEREADGGGESLTFYAFSVMAPVEWEGPGYPTIVPAGVTVTSSADVTQKPSAADLGYKDPLAVLTDAAEKSIEFGVAALLVLGAFKLFSRRRSS